MSDSSSAIKDLLRTPSRTAISSESARPAETEADQRPFASGRVGDRPQVTLCFRKKSGYVRGFSYLHFCGIESEDPAQGFAIEFSQWRITVTGHNLEPLFRMVCQHRVAEIRESDRGQASSVADQDTVVDRIDFRDGRAVK